MVTPVKPKPPKPIPDKPTTWDVDKEITTVYPKLRQFCYFLTKNSTEANDLAQTAVLKILESANSFQPGTNFKAWAYMIARNTYWTQGRRLMTGHKKEAMLLFKAEMQEAVDLDPSHKIDLDKLMVRLQTLSPEHQEALIRVCILGESYEDAGRDLGVPMGTIKSRVSRARKALIALQDPEDLLKLKPLGERKTLDKGRLYNRAYNKARREGTSMPAMPRKVSEGYDHGAFMRELWAKRRAAEATTEVKVAEADLDS